MVYIGEITYYREWVAFFWERVLSGRGGWFIYLLSSFFLWPSGHMRVDEQPTSDTHLVHLFRNQDAITAFVATMTA